jgi:hypothetical protein
VLEGSAAGAGLVLDVDDDLFVRQMRRQRAAIDPPPRSRWFGGCLVGLLRRSQRLLQVFQRKRQLIRIEPLGAATEAMTLQLVDDRDQPCDLALRAIRLAARRLELLGMARPLRQQQSPQRLGGRGKRRIRSRHREPSESHRGIPVA